MSVELDVFVVNTTIMDEEVYQLWLDGYTGLGHNINQLTHIDILDTVIHQSYESCYLSAPSSVNDAVKVRMEGGVLEGCEASAEVLHSDTMDQYRTFQMCERLLHSPVKLANQLLFQIPPHRQVMLIERCSTNS